MDKNMIKIDDLLRQRLGDAEEQERPAAWLQMRDLLDKQMPVTRAAVNWRRMFAYVAGVAILAAVSVGGYEMSQSFSGGNTTAGNTTGTGASTSPAATGLAGSAINSLPDTRIQQQLDAQTAPGTDAANGALVANSNTTSANTINKQQNATNSAANGVKDNKSQQNAVAHNTQGNKTQQNNDATANTPHNNKQEQADNATIATVDNSNKTVTAAQQKATKSASEMSGANRNKTQQTADNNDKTTAAIIPSSGKAATASSGTPSVPGKAGVNKGSQTGNANTIAGNNPEPKVEEKEIPIRLIDRVGKEGEDRMDTIFNGDAVKTVTVPNKNGESLARNDEELASGTNMMPSSAAASSKKGSGTDEAAMQKLGDHKESSKKMKNYNPQRFEEMVKNAKYSIGSMKFYPGIVGGVNASLNGNMGVHIGLAGNLSIGDRWSILTEVKYAYRFNNVKENMQDDYIDNVTPTFVNGQFVYKYDSMEHYYNFAYYQSLEVPLMVTYTNNRFVYMLGGNFRYNFRIKENTLEEVTQRYLLEQSYTTTSEPKFASEKQILLSDFGSSMSLSPMIGLGYQLSPGWRVDCRVSQSIWNNATTKGQKEIFKSLHNMPQVQFNLTHRFRSNKPYKRAR